MTPEKKQQRAQLKATAVNASLLFLVLGCSALLCRPWPELACGMAGCLDLDAAGWAFICIGAFARALATSVDV